MLREASFDYGDKRQSSQRVYNTNGLGGLRWSGGDVPDESRICLGIRTQPPSPIKLYPDAATPRRRNRSLDEGNALHSVIYRREYDDLAGLLGTAGRANGAATPA